MVPPFPLLLLPPCSRTSVYFVDEEGCRRLILGSSAIMPEGSRKIEDRHSSFIFKGLTPVRLPPFRNSGGCKPYVRSARCVFLWWVLCKQSRRTSRMSVHPGAFFCGWFCASSVDVHLVWPFIQVRFSAIGFVQVTSTYISYVRSSRCVLL